MSSGYLNVIATWLAGEPTAGMTLLGHSMLVWGRVGKLLQFVAGLSIVLDLLDPDKVRTLGARATARSARVADRIRARGDALEIVSLRDVMLDGLLPPFLDSGDVFRRVPGEAPRVVPEGAPFGLADYQALWARVRAELPGAHTCPHGESFVCPSQERHAEVVIDDFLRRHLPEPERAVLAQAGRLRKASQGWGVIVMGVMTVAAFPLLARAMTTGDWTSGLWLAPVGLAGCLAFALVTLVPGASSAALWWLAALPVRLLGRLLHRARPLHAFRWAALAFFLAGFHFDLLAS